MILVAVVMIIMILVAMILVIGILGEFEPGDRIDGFKDGHAIVGGRVDDIEQTFLECRAIDDQCVGFANQIDLLSRCLEVVGISTNRHDRDHVELVADQVRNHVAQDVRRHDNGWTTVNGRTIARRRGLGGGTATSGSYQGEAHTEACQSLPDGLRYRAEIRTENHYHQSSLSMWAHQCKSE